MILKSTFNNSQTYILISSKNKFERSKETLKCILTWSKENSSYTNTFLFNQIMWKFNLNKQVSIDIISRWSSTKKVCVDIICTYKCVKNWREMFRGKFMNNYEAYLHIYKFPSMRPTLFENIQITKHATFSSLKFVCRSSSDRVAILWMLIAMLSCVFTPIRKI